MDEAVEDGVGVGWVADDVVPSVDGQLRGDHCRAAAVGIQCSLFPLVITGGLADKSDGYKTVDCRDYNQTVRLERRVVSQLTVYQFS